MSQPPIDTSLSHDTPGVDRPVNHTITFSHPANESLEAVGRSLRSVLQDKGARLSARAFVNQSSRADEAARAHRLEETSSTSSVRTQKRSTKRRKEKITVWLERPIAAELKRLAESNQLSLSAAGAAFVTKAISLSLQEQQQTLLQPIVAQAVRQEMRTMANRLAALLVAIKLDTANVRQLEVNVLARLPKGRQMDEETLNDIRDRSQQRAKQELRARTPQLRSLIEEEMAAWLTEEDQQ
jgi:hypothetical protein